MTAAQDMVILFDIDDTLVDHSGAFRAATTSLYRSMDVSATLEEFASAWTASHRRQFDRVLAGELSYDEQGRARVRDVLQRAVGDDEADRAFNVYLDSYEANWAILPDVKTCLERLSRYRLGVISNGQAHQQRLKLERLGLSALFECVIISEECGGAKPRPEIFHQACALFGEQPQRVMYVGDMYDLDAVAAREAGLVGVWLDRGRSATPTHAPPSIQSLDELVRLVEGPEGEGQLTSASHG